MYVAESLNIKCFCKLLKNIVNYENPIFFGCLFTA